MFSLTRFASLPAAILVSLVNTQLRDHFDSLEELGLYHDISINELSAYLAGAHFFYDAVQRQFKAE